MKFWFWLKPSLIGLMFLPLGFITYFVVPFALIGATWDAQPSTDSNGTTPTIRGDLPPWAWWLATPNERLPGGTYEPTVAWWLQHLGKYACSWYWLACRNQLYGLMGVFWRPLAQPWPLEPGYYEADGLWWLRKQFTVFGKAFQFKAGYRNYFVQGRWIGVPCLTITGP